ncbi:hypothetical protein MIND_01275000 [Mycena indigotica]|uniref:Uncharacterized protein n=1 Tax=Mycena indigotica TaxID=2126181 RepID=A0A8H6VX15_9AGAR|nr:uncharacterized protein MIND_01275000 [Mycena indigotica]KAF7291309.1 hypothetical protein MIND_01275000 [Mycena indigotica]
MSTTLPIELIDAVLDNMHDIPSMKALSLAAWSFVGPCQRRFMHTVGLSDANVLPVLSLVRESPHVVKSVRRLHICPQQRVLVLPAKLEAMVTLLNLLPPLDGCVIDGKSWGGGCFLWTDVPEEVASAIGALLSKSPGAVLHLHNISAWTLPSMPWLFQVRFLSFRSTTSDPVRLSGVNATAHHGAQAANSLLRHLFLCPSSGSVAQSMTESPAFTHIYQRLEHISCYLGSHTLRLIVLTTRTLRTLHLSMDNSLRGANLTASLPEFPVLQRLTIEPLTGQSADLGGVDVISRILNPKISPVLAECRVIWARVQAGTDSETAAGPTIVTASPSWHTRFVRITAALALHPATPQVTWVLQPALDVQVDADVFAERLRLDSSELDGNGRLGFEYKNLPSVPHMFTGWPQVSLNS